MMQYSYRAALRSSDPREIEAEIDRIRRLRRSARWKAETIGQLQTALVYLALDAPNRA